MKKEYTLIAYGEDTIGLLNRITIIFTRRNINIDSLTVSKSEIEKVSRFTIVVTEEEGKVKKVVDQINKQIEVIKAYMLLEDETIFQEIALYKVSKKQGDEKTLRKIIEKNKAKIVTGNEDYVVLEKTGHVDETDALLNELKKNNYLLMQFSRSGRVAITKKVMPVSTILNNFNN